MTKLVFLLQFHSSIIKWSHLNNYCLLIIDKIFVTNKIIPSLIFAKHFSRQLKIISRFTLAGYNLQSHHNKLISKATFNSKPLN